MKKLLLALLATATLHATPWADHLGIQLWSLHKTFAEDTTKGFDEIKAFGLEYVETAGTYKLTAAQLHEELKSRKLKAVSAHMPYERLKTDIAGAIAEAKTLGVKYVVVPWIPHKGAFDVAAAHTAAADFNTFGAAFRKEGIEFGWHPHGFEFAGAEGERPFDVIVKETDPKNLFLEIDVFWVAHANVDPVKLMNKYPDRWKLMHVKDLRKGAKTDDTGAAPESDNVAVGNGSIDWSAVLNTGHKLGVKYYFIEDETSEPLRNVPESVQFLRAVK
ncbi:MAG TPA: sugar phosphate isomerase/epimerase [Opitutaceae bacterium]|nr:sugar phosphate isomerase/epimerase [Opitutaceae bacterium]